MDRPLSLTERLERGKLLLGMVHLPPLPGSPRAAGLAPRDAIAGAIESAVRDARGVLEGGLDGFVIENFNDAPFFPDRVPAITVAAMTDVISSLLQALEDDEFFGVDERPFLAVNVLRNDAAAALAIATATGLDGIRVNVHTQAMVTDQGIIEGRAHETVRERARLQSPVAILADVFVKHAAPLGRDSSDIDSVARETAQRGLADALIVTGQATGSAADLGLLAVVRDAVPDVPLLVGSGVTSENVADYLAESDGVIVGTWLKRNGDVSEPIDEERVREIVAQARG